MNWKILALAGLALGSGLILRDMFPKTVKTPLVIHTVYDTVPKLDTVYVTKLKKEAHWDTLYLEHATVTKPETVYSVPSMNTLAFLHVPQTFTGDSMFAKGFMLRPGVDSTGRSMVIGTEWQATWYAAGPLHMISMDTVPPRVSFWPMPEPPCKLTCKAKHYALGGIVTLSVYVLLHGLN